MTQEKENKTLQSNERTDCVKVTWYLIGNCSQSADEAALLASAGGCFACFTVLLPACECVLPVSSEEQTWLQFVAVLFPEVSARPSITSVVKVRKTLQKIPCSTGGCDSPYFRDGECL